MTQSRRQLLRGIGTGTAVVLGGAGAVTARPFNDKTEETAEVRVLHASPDAPPVDIFVDGTAVLTGVPFKTVSDYLKLPPGTYDFAVAPTEASVGSAVIETTVTVEAGTDYTVAAVNQLADIAPRIFVDDNQRAFPPSRARVRVVHLSPDAPAVDIAAAGPRLGSDPQVVVEDLSYQEATGYLELLPTGYEFEVRPAGSSAAVATVPADLDPGGVYSAFAVGLLEPSETSQGFDVVLAQDRPPISEETEEDEEDDADEDEEIEAGDDRSPSRGRPSTAW